MKQQSKFDVAVTVIILVLIGILVGVSVKTLVGKNEGAAMTEVRPVSAQGSGNATVTVSVASASEAIVYQTTRLYGELRASDGVNVYPSIAGKVVQYQVQKGQQIEAGQTIAVVDASKPGSPYASSAVTSPVAGRVYSLGSVAGETVNTSSVLATIMPSEKLKILVNLPERYLASIKEGMVAQFTAVPWPDTLLGATVSSIGLSVDSSSRSVEVELVVDAEDGNLKSGMFVTVDLVTAQSGLTTTIPAAALASYLDEKVVYVLNPDSTVSRRTVVVGLSNDSVVAITDGLSVGETVVVAGSVSDGTKVSVVQEAKVDKL